MNIKQNIVIRVRLAFTLIALVALAVVYALVKLAVFDAEQWQEASIYRQIQEREIKATRGNIYDAQGALLATSLPFYRLAIDPVQASDTRFYASIDSLSLLLSRRFGDRSALGYKQLIEQARQKGNRFLYLSSKEISHHELQTIKTWPLFREGKYGGGFIPTKEERRYKPFGQLASRTIGNVSDAGHSVGLEASFDHFLGGVNGKGYFQALSGGVLRPVSHANEVKPEDGYDIFTTLDVNIQDVAEASLLRQLKDRNARFGSVIVMEVQTGHIKALVNYERKSPGVYVESYNYAIGDQGLTEPGSTFKLFSMLALLEEKKVSLQDIVETGNGTHRFYDRTMRDVKVGGYGKITVQEAFEKSSNVAISKLVDQHFGHQPKRFTGYLEKLGLDQAIGFQMQGEGVPYVKTPGSKNWYGTTLPWMSIGYELRWNPLHTLMFYNAVANQGVMVKPMIVRAVGRGNEFEEIFPTEVYRKRIASDKTIRDLQRLLEGVVENGTARNIRHASYKIAGKTGTAQILENGSYTRKYYASFAGYFPADQPRYSAIVVIDSPEGLHAYGGDVSAPVFKDIADKIMSQDLELNTRRFQGAMAQIGDFPLIQGGAYQGIREVTERLALPARPLAEEVDFVHTALAGNQIVYRSGDQNVSDQVPDVTGFPLRDALYALENRGLSVQYTGSGRVKRQSIPAGTSCAGQSIHLILE
ncbi:penicillin-binding protein transpeptidase [Nitritalea halalkaliphila LW7]|uniref:Penicillin-binding protein transpeptidase n=1 Tax=Nitritalea halalkaliphila LW7 TaxID=1189621 RepID=I5C2D2_9BACT|nr:penicillin-binding protein [Nitritalea halalkaliphila]EIM75984.1 penicillin-binding protein transpeptidase [Nitritalea halalkaliphila LW7]